MKQHTVNGGRIIQDTFGHLGEKYYGKMAYEVARFHHEKWNGKGYPEGIKRKNIPLSARIMAIADVFDAVSQTRCYRAAMPLDQCFEIIEEGSGQDFEPILVEVFLEMRDEVERVHQQINDGNKERAEAGIYTSLSYRIGKLDFRGAGIAMEILERRASQPPLFS